MNDLLLFVVKNIVFTSFLYLLWKVFVGFRGSYTYSRFYLLFVAFASIPVSSIVLHSGAVMNFSPVIVEGIKSEVGAVYSGMDFGSANHFGLREVYFLGVFLYLIFFSLKLASLTRLIRSCSTVNNIYGYKLCRTSQVSMPFSFAGWIFLPESMGSESADMIIEHELAHLRYKHTADMIFIEILIAFLWFNPVVYFIRKDLKLIHEIQADRRAVSSVSLDKYIKLFIGVLRTDRYTLYSSFYSKQIKKRIAMMTQKNKTSKFSVFAISLIAIVFAAILPASAQQNTAVDKKAEFPGGNVALRNYISEHINYPNIAKEKGYQDVVVVRFTVDKNGNVKKPVVVKGKYDVLNKEAIRVVSTFPKFKPAEKNGKKVASQMEIAITFRLD